MLREYALNYITLGVHISEVESGFNAAFESGNNSLSAVERDSLRAMLSNLVKICADLDLIVAPELLRNAENDLPQTSREFRQLIRGVSAELKKRKVIIVPPHRDKYLEKDDVVSDMVTEAFSKASEEIKEAANCFALERYTSSVFHSMRAAEIGLRALGQKLNVKIRNGKEIEFAEWREILDGLNTAIRDFENLPNDTPNKDDDLRVYSEACAQFRFSKMAGEFGWRTPARHTAKPKPN